MSGGRKTEETAGAPQLYFDSFADADNTLLSAHVANSGATYAHSVDNGGDIRIAPIGDLRGQGIIAGSPEIYAISQINNRLGVNFSVQVHRYSSITGEWRIYLDWTDANNFVLMEIKNVDADQLSLTFTSRVAAVSTVTGPVNIPHALGDNHTYSLVIDGTTAHTYRDGTAIQTIAYAGPARTGQGAIGTAHGSAAATGMHLRTASY